MTTHGHSTITGATGKLLYTEKLFALARTLQTWRLDPVMQQLDAEREEGRVLGFVKGLRLSAQVAYLIRDVLSGSGLEVSWGHLIDDAGVLCSPECDIIIHEPGFVGRWNGGEEPIMDFRFIECSKALAVISCKSYTKGIDKDYCKGFANHGLKTIILFAECCPTGRTDQLTKQALAAGYSGLYYLYTLGDGAVIQQDPAIYVEFVKAVMDLADNASAVKGSGGRKGGRK